MGAVRDITLKNYIISLQWLKRIAPKVMICEMDKRAYLNIIKEYAATHEKPTVSTFHHHLKAAIKQALEDMLILKDPTQNIPIKDIRSKKPRHKKVKYLNRFQFDKLLSRLKITSEANNDLLILLVAKTGLRFSESLRILWIEGNNFSELNGIGYLSQLTTLLVANNSLNSLDVAGLPLVALDVRGNGLTLVENTNLTPNTNLDWGEERSSWMRRRLVSGYALY